MDFEEFRIYTISYDPPPNTHTHTHKSRSFSRRVRARIYDLSLFPPPPPPHTGHAASADEFLPIFIMCVLYAQASSQKVL